MKIEDVRNRVVACKSCELCKTRTNAVPGKGSFNADIVFVGEAPGRNEDRCGEPFVGAAGKRLSSALEKAGIARDDVYITNVVKCRPPENRVPRQDERTACMGHLRDEIRIIRPRIICVMGNTAFHSLLSGSDIMKYRGKIFAKEDNLYFISLHPAATIYNHSLKSILEDDIKELVKASQRIKNGEKVRVDRQVTA